LKKKEDKLFAIVEELKGQAPGEINWADKSLINGYKNGTNHRISVNILTREDGKEKIISTIKDMCRDEKLTSNDVTIEAMEDRLNKSYSPAITEPNMLVYFGEMCSVHGFLPWHIRLTEFFKLDCTSVVRQRDFVEILHRYQRCEQRFGK
jgi:dehydrodolichyl diphosphate syntase complex subunit NUS1